MLKADVVERVLRWRKDNGLGQILQCAHDDALALKTIADTGTAFPAIQAGMPRRRDRADHKPQNRDRQHHFQQGEGCNKTEGWKIGRMAGWALQQPPIHLSRLLLLCGQTLATSFSFSSLLLIGNTHLNRSSLIVVGIFIHIRQNISILEKPPYVCGHYRDVLTK